MTLNPADLRIDTFRASGAGGQHVNKTDSAIRITHLPTGLVAECQDDRSQHRNKAKAMAVLAARLRDKDRNERAAKEAATRKGLIGSGDRSDRIRTYNFPQGRLTDHRINLTLYKLDRVMDGDLDDVVGALRAARAAEQLAVLESGRVTAAARGTCATVGAALAHARTLGVDRLDAQLLLARALQHARAWLLAHDEAALADAQQARFASECRRRADGEPLAYLLGEREFHGLLLRITPDVLVPRPDTETLVDWALELLAGPLRSRSGTSCGRPGHRQRRDRAGAEAPPPWRRRVCAGPQCGGGRAGAGQRRSPRPARSSSWWATGGSRWPAGASIWWSAIRRMWRPAIRTFGRCGTSRCRP